MAMPFTPLLLNAIAVTSKTAALFSPLVTLFAIIGLIATIVTIIRWGFYKAKPTPIPAEHTASLKKQNQVTQQRIQDANNELASLSKLIETLTQKHHEIQETTKASTDQLHAATLNMAKTSGHLNESMSLILTIATKLKPLVFDLQHMTEQLHLDSTNTLATIDELTKQLAAQRQSIVDNQATIAPLIQQNRQKAAEINRLKTLLLNISKEYELLKAEHQHVKTAMHAIEIPTNEEPETVSNSFFSQRR